MIDSIGEGPEISVCILTWNQSAFIRQAIISAVSQNVDTKMEVLVGDDCSTDGTDEIVRAMESEFPGVVKLVRHASQLGASGNYKKLLELAQGRFIAHLDGDDYWLPGKLQAQIDVMRNSSSCSAVYTNALVVDAMGTPRGLFNDSPTQDIDLAQLLARGNFLNTSSMFFRASAKHLLLAVHEPFIDFRIHLRLARMGHLAVISESFVVYRVNSPTSMLARDESNVRHMYWQAILDTPRDLVSDNDFAQGVADFYRRVLFRAVQTGNAALAKEWWPKIRGSSPQGVIRMSWLLFRACLRAASNRLFGLINTGASGPRPRVFYRR